MLKKLTPFYLYIVFPLLTISLLLKLELINSTVFTIGILIYAIIFHPIISGIRLQQLGVTKSSDFYKNFIPLWNLQYFEALFLGKI